MTKPCGPGGWRGFVTMEQPIIHHAPFVMTIQGKVTQRMQGFKAGPGYSTGVNSPA